MEPLKFKGWLAANGITNDEVAEVINVSRTTANYKINGKKQFTIKEAKILSEHFGISINDYFL